MRIVYLLRKPTTEPTVATNALRWGAGALNIDATRIAFTDAIDPGAVQRQHADAGVVSFGAAGLIGKEIPMYKPGGRWPANLILQHRPACVREGARSVGSGDKRINEGDEFYGGVHEGYTRPNRSSYTHKIAGQVRTYGTEVIAAWVCAEGCPVAALDGQSGVSISTGGKSSGFTAFGQGSGWNHHKNRPTEITRHQDTGGASRFFLTIGGQTPQPKETP